MSDLIDKNAAIDAVAFGITYAKAFDKETGEVKELFAQGNYELRKAVDRIKELPSADAVEVVRCKDCKHRVYTDDGESCPDDIVCDLWESDGFTETDYCSWGERRPDATN